MEIAAVRGKAAELKKERRVLRFSRRRMEGEGEEGREGEGGEERGKATGSDGPKSDVPRSSVPRSSVPQRASFHPSSLSPSPRRLPSSPPASPKPLLPSSSRGEKEKVDTLADKIRRMGVGNDDDDDDW